MFLLWHVATSFGILFQMFADNIGEVCRELWLAVNAVVVNFVAAAKAIWPYCTRENIIMVLTTADFICIVYNLPQSTANG
jgi:hypothetical protein